MSLNEAYFSVAAPDAHTPEEALDCLRQGLRTELSRADMDESALVLLRFFSSDATRHAAFLKEGWPHKLDAQVILIGQTPLDSRYLSLQAWALRGSVEKTFAGDGSLILRHGGYKSLWSLDAPKKHGDSERQTDEILAGLENRLCRHGMSLESNVVRTWYYMRDVDNNYAGMIKSRVRHYEIHGLTAQSHFIASTGIEGQMSEPSALSWMQSHAMAGLLPGQLEYLRALDNMSPTAVYGVNFERGTLITYGDRKHAHISGTASIDAQGDVVFKGDVSAQARRALANVEALLKEGGMSFEDMRAATLYCRDAYDFQHVAALVRETLPPHCAVNINKAPVCRPDWLVEIEGEAVRETPTPQFANYL